MTLFYGGRSADDLFYLDYSRTRASGSCSPPKTASRGETGRVTVPLDRALAGRATEPVTLYACGPEPMLAAVRTSQRSTAGRAKSRSNA